VLSLGVFTKVEVKAVLDTPTERRVPIRVVVSEGGTHAVHVGAAIEQDTNRSRIAVRAGWESRNFLGGLRKLSLDVTPGLTLYPLSTEGASVRVLPELESAPPARLLYLNYPNNPTGATAELDFFERAVEFARERDLVVVHDNAYSEVAFDGYRPPSFLEAAGAKEVGVEIFSLSKGWNMTGWRAGLVAGNADVVERYRQLKTNLDSGMFDAVQHASAVALTDAREFPREMSAVYERRRDLLAEALGAIGLEVDPPQATPYFWVRVPEGHDSASFTELVLEQAGVVISPGPSFGPSGEGFVRLSLTVPDSRLEEAARRVESSLKSGIIQA